MWTLGVIALLSFVFKWGYNLGLDRGKQKVRDELKQDIEWKQLVEHYKGLAEEQNGNPFAS